MITNEEGQYRIIKSLQNRCYHLKLVNGKNCLELEIPFTYRGIIYRLLNKDNRLSNEFFLPTEVLYMDYLTKIIDRVINP